VFFGIRLVYIPKVMAKRKTTRPSGPQEGWRFNSAVSSPLGGVTSAGFVPDSTHGSGPERLFGQYALVYVLEGDASYSDARGVRQNIGPGDMILVFPDLAHTYGPKGAGVWTTLWMSFAGKIFDLWRRQGLLDDRKPVYHLEPLDVWFRRLDAILGVSRQAEYANPQADYAPPLLEVCRLQMLLAEIVSGAGRQVAYQDDLRWASRACAMLDPALAAETDWKKIAHELGTTPETFRKRFTRLVGHPPARYRMGRLVDRACELMQERRLTDKQIADALGFCDEFYFSRRFKQITGTSPRAFRRLLTVGK